MFRQPIDALKLPLGISAGAVSAGNPELEVACSEICECLLDRRRGGGFPGAPPPEKVSKFAATQRLARRPLDLLRELVPALRCHLVTPSLFGAWQRHDLVPSSDDLLRFCPKTARDRHPLGAEGGTWRSMFTRASASPW
jgi:hypothetical protein